MGAPLRGSGRSTAASEPLRSLTMLPGSVPPGTQAPLSTLANVRIARRTARHRHAMAKRREHAAVPRIRVAASTLTVSASHNRQSAPLSQDPDHTRANAASRTQRPLSPLVNRVPSLYHQTKNLLASPLSWSPAAASQRASGDSSVRPLATPTRTQGNPALLGSTTPSPATAH